MISVQITGKNNGLPFLDILGYLKNTHKNPKFGRVRQVPPRELGWEFLFFFNFFFKLRLIGYGQGLLIFHKMSPTTLHNYLYITKSLKINIKHQNIYSNDKHFNP